VADSVIVLDEVQSIPWRLIEPTVDMLRELVRSYGCSIVLSTATQPPLARIGTAADVSPTVLTRPEWDAQFRRVTARFEPRLLSWNEVADRMIEAASQSQQQCLSIVNTISDARALTQELAGHDGVTHLTTRMCPAHRRTVLATIRERLDTGAPVIVVSTQLIEAGVDLDFPVGFRAVAPLPAMVQAAGRVNRGGRYDDALLHLYQPADGHVPPAEYEIGLNVALDLLRHGADPLDPGTLERYYDRFLDAIASLLDAERIQAERALLNFETVGERFRLIADDGVPVIVSYGEIDTTSLVLPEDPVARRRALRRLQPYTVNIRPRDAAAALAAQQLRDLGGGVQAWLGPYDPTLGVMTDTTKEALIW
jgi:CRISPR-associated endonuclease/helicase Cas3